MGTTAFSRNGKTQMKNHSISSSFLSNSQKLKPIQARFYSDVVTNVKETELWVQVCNR